MKPAELRIGNHVRLKYHDYDEIDTHHEIVGITEEHPYLNTITFDSLEYDEIEPIELTKTWIDSLPKQIGSDYSNMLHYNFSIDINGCFIWIGGFKRYIKHIHEYQNLYFVLVGEELKN